MLTGVSIPTTRTAGSHRCYRRGLCQPIVAESELTKYITRNTGSPAGSESTYDRI